MNLKYYRAPDFNNFGDELNPFIFNHLFGDIFSLEKYTDIDFYGIGSIIDSRINSEIKTVLFGSGIRDITRKYHIDKWDIRFLRGPISSNALGFNGEKYIVDSAYCMLCDEALLPDCSIKKFKYSLMPHFRHIDKLDWKFVSNLTNVHIINPRSDYKQVLKEIAETENLLSIAMHGAIVADILRVPWQRIKMEAIGSETILVSEMKWMDFTSSLDLNDSNVHIKNYHLPLKKGSPYCWNFYYELVTKIKQAKMNKKFQLTSDIKIKDIKLRIEKEIDKFRNEYK